MEEFRNSYRYLHWRKEEDISLAFIVKALTASLKKFPNFNSSIDEIESGKMTIKNIIILVLQ